MKTQLLVQMLELWEQFEPEDQLLAVRMLRGIYATVDRESRRPTVVVELPKLGKDLDMTSMMKPKACVDCGWLIKPNSDYNYCPECGAMIG